MKAKLSLIFFLIISVFFIALYVIFPLEDDNKEVVPEIIGQQIEFPNEVVGLEVLSNQELDTVVQTEVEERTNTEEEAEAETNENEEEEPKPAEKPKKTTADKIIRYARTKLQKPYKVAGTTDNGYDCSGLIMVSYAKEGVKLPRASYRMAEKGSDVSKKDVKKGDLLFFATRPNQPKRVSHVGMVTKVKEGKIFFIHSSDKSGVIVNTMDEGYYRKRFLKAKRFLKDE